MPEDGAEAIHRDLTHKKLRAFGMKAVTCAASARLKGNIAEASDVNDTAVFDHEWATYQRVAQRKLSYPDRRARLHYEKLLEYVYQVPLHTCLPFNVELSS